MSVRFAILASGSKGNAALIQSGGTSVLIDAGLSIRELERRLGVFGLSMPDIAALIVTHLHGDHLRNPIITACTKHRVPLYHHRQATAGIAKKFSAYRALSEANLGVVYDSAPFRVGEMELEPVSVPHDAEGGTNAIIANCTSGEHRRRIVVATDFGKMPRPLIRKFANSDALVMEFNHDEEMLWNSRRALCLKERVTSGWGHMSNMQAAQALADIVAASERCPSIVVQAHISGECNTHELALDAAQNIIAEHGIVGMRIHPAHQDKPTGWFDLTQAAPGGK